MYWEVEQRQAYTSKGFIFGDWIGREAKGGQAWLTYHLSWQRVAGVPVSQRESSEGFHPHGHHAERLQGERCKALWARMSK